MNRNERILREVAAAIVFFIWLLRPGLVVAVIAYFTLIAIKYYFP